MTQRLIDAFDGIVCDLDGVVYRGRDAVPHAIAGLDGARRAGLRIAYATNNASRPPQEVRGQLSDLGLDLELRDVVTSSQAGAVHLAETLPAGATVLAIGGVGVAQALEEQGLRVVRAADVQEGGPEHGTHVEAVLQGLGTDVSWRDLAQAAFAIARGARWVATNVDTTLPTHQGLAPGNGALVGVVRHAVDVDPHVVGKPESPLYELAARVLDLLLDPGRALQRRLLLGDVLQPVVDRGELGVELGRDRRDLGHLRHEDSLRRAQPSPAQGAIRRCSATTSAPVTGPVRVQGAVGSASAARARRRYSSRVTS